MRTISLKIADSILEEIDENLEMYNFTTRTEFVREAIRDKLTKLQNQHFEQELREFFKNHKEGLKGDISNMTRDVFLELEQRFGH